MTKMKALFSIILFISLLVAQPDPQFEAFDWILYTQNGCINSISKGFNYTYFATENSGVLRYDIYSEKFDDPITTAQGLSDNEISAVYFDKGSGILWAITKNHINYSYDAKGNWSTKRLAEYGLKKDHYIQQIGGSANYIWINAGSIFVKVDKVSGISFGTYPTPDENDIEWSSPDLLYSLIPDDLLNYTIIGNWMINTTSFIDPNGNWIDLSTYYYDREGNIFVGLEDGTILIGNTYNEILYPYTYGLNQFNVNEFTNGNILWLVGDYSNKVRGITGYKLDNNEFYHIDFENEINFNPNTFNSIIETKNEIWIGGYSNIAIYNKKKEFWKEISEDRGLPNSIINTLVEDKNSVWVGTNRGLVELSKHNKYTIESEIESLLRIEKINDLEIFDDDLWIATDENLFKYDKTKKIITDFKKIGKTENINNQKGGFYHFGKISNDNGILYFSTNIGILSYNLTTEEWNIAVEPSMYRDSRVNTIAIKGKYCFLGTDNGIWQINMKDGYSQPFDYKFIGKVNDLFIRDDLILIGCENGLIKFFWKKNI